MLETGYKTVGDLILLLRGVGEGPEPVRCSMSLKILQIKFLVSSNIVACVIQCDLSLTSSNKQNSATYLLFKGFECPTYPCHKLRGSQKEMIFPRYSLGLTFLFANLPPQLTVGDALESQYHNFVYILFIFYILLLF